MIKRFVLHRTRSFELLRIVWQPGAHLPMHTHPAPCSFAVSKGLLLSTNRSGGIALPSTRSTDVVHLAPWEQHEVYSPVLTTSFHLYGYGDGDSDDAADLLLSLSRRSADFHQYDVNVVV